MITRTFTLDTIQGETDQAAAQAFLDAQNTAASAIAERDGTAFTPDALGCNVTLILKNAAGERLEIACSDWAEVAGLAVGQSFTISLGG